MEASFARTESRRSIEMSDAQRVKIGHQLFGVPKAKVEVELNAVGSAGRGHGLGHPHSQLLPQSSKTLIPLRNVAARPMRFIAVRRTHQHGVVDVLNLP